ncbi:MAG: leucine-rich repeat domain-containing protein [Lachnospiraceae bacterium]|nr:leucine-rich repeat domain-containing protein [Lachnospiraceae bacterium]
MKEKKLIIEQGISSVEPEAFAEEGWTEVILPLSVISIGAAAFMNCAALERIILPEGLKEIGEGAFTGCTSLAEIQLPDRLEVIGEMAFFGSGLREITVPSGVLSVGEMAFWDCTELKSAKVTGKKTRLEKDAFGSCPKLREGYLAPGFPEKGNPAEKLQMLLLWCTAPELYDEETNRKAEGYFLENEELIMDRIFRDNNEEALRGLLERSPEKVKSSIRKHGEQYILRCAELGKRQGMQALILSKKSDPGTDRTSFFPAEDLFDL